MQKIPLPRAPSRKGYGLGEAGGEAASLREAPLPQAPSSEERLAFGLYRSSSLVPPEGGCVSKQLGCGHGGVGDFVPAGTRRWLSDRPRHPFGSLTYELVSYPALAGRGGSVSRRDHNKAYRRPHPNSQAEPTMQKHPTQTPAALREGARGRRLLSEKPPPSHPPVTPRSGK